MRLRNKSILLFLIVTFSMEFCSLSSTVACKNNYYDSVHSEWRILNGQRYLYAEANDYYTLGFLEGKNLGFQTAWMKLMIILQAEQLGLSYDIAKYYALKYLDYFPYEYLLEMNGFADAIDYIIIPFMNNFYNITIDFFDVLVQNCFWDIYYGQIIPKFSGYPQPPLIMAGCTAIGSNTGRKAILGQTIDLTFIMKPATSWVYTKIQDKCVFSFRMGSILAMGGVNVKGVTISVNLLEVFNVGCLGKPISVIYRSVLENARTCIEAKSIVLNNDFTLGWNYIIKDKTHLIAIETIPNSYYIEYIKKGCYTFDANMYENLNFRAYMIYATNYIDRYNQASKLCQYYQQDGNLNIQDLFEIYSDPIISRRYTSTDSLEVGTAGAFFIDERNNIYFCLGNPLDSDLGVIRRFG
ncbi:MAG: carcinine hydrolase/isopenicillin-N N-acyltransferase family protein [Candidatus Thorarchaeota archaeon]